MPAVTLSLSYRNATFEVNIANSLARAVNVWSTDCSCGYEAFRFRVFPERGGECVIRRKPALWTVNILRAVTIQPGASHTERFAVADGTWDLGECQRNLGSPVDVAAVIEIADNQEAASYSVVTGRFESNRIHIASLEGGMRNA